MIESIVIFICGIFIALAFFLALVVLPLSVVYFIVSWIKEIFSGEIKSNANSGIVWFDALF